MITTPKRTERLAIQNQLPLEYIEQTPSRRHSAKYIERGINSSLYLFIYSNTVSINLNQNVNLAQSAHVPPKQRHQISNHQIEPWLLLYYCRPLYYETAICLHHLKWGLLYLFSLRLILTPQYQRLKIFCLL